jgi:hypothetical protein
VIYPGLGFWLLFGTPLFDSDRASRVAALLTDPRWPYQPALVLPTPAPGDEIYGWPRGKVAAKVLAPTIEGVIRSPLARGIHLSMSRKDAANHAFVYIDNGSPRAFREPGLYPYTGHGLVRFPLPPAKNIEGWLALVRELAAVLEAVHGVIWVDMDERFLIGRQFISGTPDPREPPDYPGNEARRIVRARNLLGDRYVRFPGWATLLRSAHVDAIGGREKLLSIVKPPVVHDVGDLLYVQLSSSVEDALAPETEARRQALVELLGPIIVPPPQ